MCPNEGSSLAGPFPLRVGNEAALRSLFARRLARALRISLHSKLPGNSWEILHMVFSTISSVSPQPQDVAVGAIPLTHSQTLWYARSIEVGAIAER